MRVAEARSSTKTLPSPIESVLAAADPQLRDPPRTGAPPTLNPLQPTRALPPGLGPRRVAALHVSGCAKGCAHPGAADVTLVATAAGFDLIRGGTAADAAVAALTADELLARPEILTESFDAP